MCREQDVLYRCSDLKLLISEGTDNDRSPAPRDNDLNSFFFFLRLLGYQEKQSLKSSAAIQQTHVSPQTLSCLLIKKQNKINIEGKGL